MATCNNGSDELLRELTVEQRNVSSLKSNPRNARTHSKKQVKAITESIHQFGFTTPILVDDDGMILAGHGRLQAAKLLGLDTVPIIQISALTLCKSVPWCWPKTSWRPVPVGTVNFWQLNLASCRPHARSRALGRPDRVRSG